MGTAAGTIEVQAPRQAIRLAWLVALLVAALVAILGTWALTSSPEGTVPSGTTPAESSEVEAPSGWRTGPNGELMPRPFAPIPK
jgi:hypothetical protein